MVIWYKIVKLITDFGVNWQPQVVIYDTVKISRPGDRHRPGNFVIL